MKETPILFSTAMVQAILNGTKTQTRRVCKYNVVRTVIDNTHSIITLEKDGKHSLRPINGPSCPYGTIGDILYVRETFYAYGQWVKNGVTKTGKQKWKFIYKSNKFHYPPITIFHKVHKNSHRLTAFYKRPALFMPKSAARIWLQITGIKVERLQTITEDDAKAEGVQQIATDSGIVYKCYLPPAAPSKTAYHSFASLWWAINGMDSWDANPYVWAIEFKVISKTGKA